MKRAALLMLTLLIAFALIGLIAVLLLNSSSSSAEDSIIRARLYHHCALERIADAGAQDDRACQEWTAAVFETSIDALRACHRAEPADQDALSACLNRAELRPEFP